MTTLSLGEQLKANKERIENEARDKALREKAAAEAKAKAARDAVTEFFSSSRALFTERILRGLDAGYVKLGDGSFNKANEALETFRWRGDNDGITQPTHEYYAIWKEFADWAEANGLAPTLKYDDDGVGRTYWHILKVQPLN